jgi:hypothetical protein
MTVYEIHITTAEGRKHISRQNDKELAEHIAENARRVGDEAVVKEVKVAKNGS